MVKTTIFLSERVKARLAHEAARRHKSESALVEEVFENYFAVEAPALMPTFGWIESDDPTLAERFDDILAEGFGAP